MEAEGRRGRVTRSLDRSFPGLRFRIVDEQERIRPPHQVLRQRRPDLRAPGTRRAFRRGRRHQAFSGG